MQSLSAIFFIITLFEGLSHTLSAEPYCYKNVTETSQRMILKTRLIVVLKKGLFNKLAQKKGTQVETYEDYEPVYTTKLQRECCEGYKLTELSMCEPQCIKNGCPAHSKCVEPEVCECVAGYYSVRSAVDNKHYCEPICEQTCPEHSVCVAPNECACKKGFKVTESKICEPYCNNSCAKGSKCVAPNECQCPEGFKIEQDLCLAVCSLGGHQCQNGRCLSDDLCRCNDGFAWNYETLQCETNSSSIEGPEFEMLTHVTAIPSKILQTDIVADDIDLSQVFEELITTTYSALEDFDDISTASTQHKAHKCPDDFVYHKGECKALKFISNEFDCRLKPCQDKHSYCLENGTCACNEGYQWFQLHVVNQESLNETINTMCLTTAEYEAQKQLENQQILGESSTSWATIFFIVLGVLVMVTALIFLSLKVIRTKTGELDVEGKTLSCSYDHRACNEDEKSVI